MSHDPVKFGVPINYGSGDIMVVVCHMISQDHVIVGSLNFVDGSTSW